MSKIEIKVSNESHEVAREVWEKLILPILGQRYDVCGDIEAVQFFHDLLYLMMSARITSFGEEAHEEMSVLLREALDDHLAHNGLASMEVDSQLRQ